MNHCIYYEYTAPFGTAAAAVYIAIVVGAGALSGRYMVKILFGLIAFLAFIASWLYYENFTSVWCFFAAIVSVLIYLIVTGTELKKKKTNAP